jgi:Neurotransmitter-gated ion-channel ligand binding domain
MLLPAILLLSINQALGLFPKHPSPISKVSIDFKGLALELGQKQFPKPRFLQQLSNETSQVCSICDKYEILSDVIPYSGPVDGLPPNQTCEEWDQLATMLSPKSEGCIGVQEFFTTCCEGPASYRCERTIRKSILNDDYDSVVPPIINSKKKPQKVTVDVTLVFLTVTDLSVQKGTAEIFVWLYLSWVDPRLSWSINSENCAESVNVRASLDAQITEIWVPDFDLLNAASGVRSFADALATVTYDGSVFWGRSGSLKAICQFTGLAKIPYDQLGCQFLFGPWARRESTEVSYRLSDDSGFVFGDFAPTYNEFKLLPDLVESDVDDWMISYVFYFQRATSFYVSNIVVPTILLTYISFGIFLLDMRVGERLSFGMSLTLVIVAQQIVTSGFLPISDAKLWIDRFIGWSFYWVILGLVESVLIGYLFFIREDLIIPRQDADKVSKPEQPNGENDSSEYGDIDEAITKSSLPQNPKVVASLDSQPANFFNLKQRLKNSRNAPNDPVPLPKFHARVLRNLPIRKVDHFFFAFTIVTYSIFILVMYLTLPKWGEGVDPDYSER